MDWMIVQKDGAWCGPEMALGYGVMVIYVIMAVSLGGGVGS